jgi:hypothetical protein
MADPMVAVLVERVDNLIAEVRAQASEHVAASDCRGTHIGVDAALRDVDRRLGEMAAVLDRAAGRRWQVWLIALSVPASVVGGWVSALLVR